MRKAKKSTQEVQVLPVQEQIFIIRATRTQEDQMIIDDLLGGMHTPEACGGVRILDEPSISDMSPQRRADAAADADSCQVQNAPLIQAYAFEYWCIMGKQFAYKGMQQVTKLEASTSFCKAGLPQNVARMLLAQASMRFRIAHQHSDSVCNLLQASLMPELRLNDVQVPSADLHGNGHIPSPPQLIGSPFHPLHVAADEAFLGIQFQ